uniref:Uncharacterized protein n=1 Tax=Corynebacterium phage HS03 TaxID=3056390 RepID=A0AA49X266_9VIRU|nr:MAG: hypothetical protein [Corynebacterium phage HS03]
MKAWVAPPLACACTQPQYMKLAPYALRLCTGP